MITTEQSSTVELEDLLKGSLAKPAALKRPYASRFSCSGVRGYGHEESEEVHAKFRSSNSPYG